jgi:putative transposase
MSIANKKGSIVKNNASLSIKRQCELISLPRSNYYRTGCGIYKESDKSLKLMNFIEDEYTRHPFYGTRKMRDYLRRQGYNVNRKRVQRLMRVVGIQSVAPKPNTSIPRKEHKTFPYLLRGLNISRPDQVWCSDITYLRLPGGFVYLTAVMDWHSRYVLSWEVSVTMDDDFCVSSLGSAIRNYGTPEIFNTDQGSQYTGEAFTGLLKSNGIKISMDGKGRFMDNIFIERLWRSLKYEEIYLKEYTTVKELSRELKKYFEFYNNERPHQSLGANTPAEVYWGEEMKRRAA